MERAIKAGIPVTYINMTVEVRDLIKELQDELQEDFSVSLLGDVIDEEDIPLTMSTMGTPDTNPFFSKDEQEFKSREDAKIVEEPEGTPLFLLFNLPSETNIIIHVAFDSCSSYTLFDSCVPTRMLRAAPDNLP